MDFELTSRSGRPPERASASSARAASRWRPCASLEAQRRRRPRRSWRELADAGVFTLRVARSRRWCRPRRRRGRARVRGAGPGARARPARRQRARGVGARRPGRRSRRDRRARGRPGRSSSTSACSTGCWWSTVDGVDEVDPRALVATRTRRPGPLDPLTPVWRGRRRCRSAIASATATRQRACRVEGAALTAAMQLGLVRSGRSISRSPTPKEREQFDRPIGSFQAVKHLLADMLVRTEVARAAVYAAGVTIDDPEVGDAEPRRRRGQGHRRRRRRPQRQDRHPGPRRHGLHLGGRRPPLPQARLGPRHRFRHARPGLRVPRQPPLTILGRVWVV